MGGAGMNTYIFSFLPVGYIKETKGKITIRIDNKFKRGLKHIEKFSHIHVFTWLHHRYQSIQGD